MSQRPTPEKPLACCLCQAIMPDQREAESDNLGARVDHCSPWGASYEYLTKREGGMRDVDPYDPDLALEEARARGEAWPSLAHLVRAHKRFLGTGRKPGERHPGEATLEAFGVDA